MQTGNETKRQTNSHIEISSQRPNECEKNVIKAETASSEEREQIG